MTLIVAALFAAAAWLCLATGAGLVVGPRLANRPVPRKSLPAAAFASGMIFIGVALRLLL